MKIFHLTIMAAFVGLVFILGFGGEEDQILNFNECVLAGNSVMESYPRQCHFGGVTYVEDIGNELEKAGSIRISSPRPNQRVNSPLIIKGQAVGTWFFEGDFPVEIKDDNGEVLGRGFVTAEEDAYTEDFVSFLGTLNFKSSSTTNGDLYLIKDNPSDDLEKNDILEVPVVFQIN